MAAIMTTTIIETAPRRLMWGTAADNWQFLTDGVGFWGVPWLDVNKLTKGERVQYEADCVEMEALEASMRAAGIPIDDLGPEGTPLRFPTLALAKEWANLVDAEESIDADLRAYHAPSECYTDAYRGREEARNALLEKAL